ncbi:kinase-like domain-containing protein [Blyttiomyces helicus]|uniref:non-specific serine/threonine protein kinase n=1 Tax=Blyttiomyces helicus TaxID=388810 RepID=A0A4P9VX65_9FUNG|nr:kinase-like domain-containing protein [Blyttiomyces helicus]|eukprot:RKO82870.1 kinase-like domain-containing protein [Blyttiomyces helicus]
MTHSPANPWSDFVDKAVTTFPWFSRPHSLPSLPPPRPPRVAPAPTFKVAAAAAAPHRTPPPPPRPYHQTQIARAYPRACEDRPKDYADWEGSNVVMMDGSRYILGPVLGRGKYSTVHDAGTVDGRPVVVKALKAFKSKKFKREILVLERLRGGPNIIEFYGAFINEVIENENWKELYPTLSLKDIRHYSLELLRAVDFAHSKGIMHRDIKPHNIAIDHSRREVGELEKEKRERL